jgi:hypothetical protein
VSFSCGFACDPGYATAGATCAPPPPPLQRAPLSTATVTSQRPTLRWSLAGGATGAHVTLCRNRALTTGCVSFDAVGASGTPAAAMSSPGVWYWQLAARVGTTTLAATSPTWEFTVGARTATTADTSWGTTLDVNGDGFADLVVGAMNAPFTTAAGLGRVHVYLGGGGVLAATPATSLVAPVGVNASFGTSVASAGDVNGDGFADLVVGAHGGSTSAFTVLGPGYAYVYLGGAGGLATVPASTLVGPAGTGGRFGQSVASAGDVNGDGYADVVVGADGANSAYLYLGSATGLGTTPATTLSGPGDSGFGWSVAGAGDANGDGYGDVVIGAYGFGRAYVYPGSATGIATTPTTTLAVTGASYFGQSVASAGDVNGDGFADLAVGAHGSARTYLFLGSSSGHETAPATTLTSPDPGHFGWSVASAGDVNADGYGDLVVGDGLNSTSLTRAYVYHGSAVGLPSAPNRTLTDPGGVGSGFGSSVAGVGDVNGDGYGDLAVGASGYVGFPATSTTAGFSYFFVGSATGLAATPATTLAGPDGARGGFGVSVASVSRQGARSRATWRWTIARTGVVSPRGVGHDQCF